MQEKENIPPKGLYIGTRAHERVCSLLSSPLMNDVKTAGVLQSANLRLRPFDRPLGQLAQKSLSFSMTRDHLQIQLYFRVQCSNL